MRRTSPFGDRRQATEVEAHEQHNAPRGQEQPPPGERPAPLSEAAGPQAAVTGGHVAAGAPSLFVAPVAEHDGFDDATVHSKQKCGLFRPPSS